MLTSLNFTTSLFVNQFDTYIYIRYKIDVVYKLS